MLFDDRLATVLRHSTTSEAGLRTQFRQLLDLLGSPAPPRAASHGTREQSLLSAAWLRMDALASAIPAEERARIIREPGWRFRSPALAAYLADHEPEVACAALTRADLLAEEWAALIPQLPIRARGFLRLRRDLPLDATLVLDRLGVHDRGLPSPASNQSVTDQSAPADQPPRIAARLRAVPASSDTVPSAQRPTQPHAAINAQKRDREASERSEISALVERIAQFRRDRSEPPADPDQSPRLPLDDGPTPSRQPATSFGFVADAAGRIEWATGDLAPMVVGIRLLKPAGAALHNAEQASAPHQSREEELARTFGRRQPIIRAPVILQGAGPIAGEWLVDGEPRFTAEGHFAGYHGRFRRRPSAADALPEAAMQEADRIRQLLHELRTPVTAVQGYAEVIQQQLFGPAPHEYRALAAAIAADAAHILAGFDELDRLARLETGALAIAPGTSDLAPLVRRIADQIAPVLGPRNAGITLADDRGTSLLIGIDEDDAEALLWRLLATLAGCCDSGETLAMRLSPVFDGPLAMAQLYCDLPASLRGDDAFLSELKLAGQTISAGLFGAGFSLRLARAEATRAGGALAQDGHRIVLRLPLITEAETIPRSVAGNNAG
ncbi:MAG: histidine kinase dimerization/phospho-acceptor domain-containing protein [Erythrobacter sp.]